MLGPVVQPANKPTAMTFTQGRCRVGSHHCLLNAERPEELKVQAFTVKWDNSLCSAMATAWTSLCPTRLFSRPLLLAQPRSVPFTAFILDSSALTGHMGAYEPAPFSLHQHSFRWALQALKVSSSGGRNLYIQSRKAKAFPSYRGLATDQK